MSTLERQQDRSPKAPLPLKTLKRSMSQNESQILTETSRTDQNHFYTNYDEYIRQSKVDQTLTNCLLKITIDKLTIKRNTLYDRAKLKVYLEHCRKKKKKAEFDSIKVNEDEFRQTIEELHEEEVVSQLKKREELLQRVKSLQSENDLLSKKYINDCSFLRSSLKNSQMQSFSGVSLKESSVRQDTYNQIMEYGYNSDKYCSIVLAQNENNVKTNSSLVFSQSPYTNYNPEDTERYEDVHQVREYSYDLSRCNESSQEETIDILNGEATEGGVNKFCSQTVGNVAQMKKSHKQKNKSINSEKDENLEETARFSFSQSKDSQSQYNQQPVKSILIELSKLDAHTTDKIFDLKSKSRNKMVQSQVAPFSKQELQYQYSFKEAKQFQDLNKQSQNHQNSKWTLNEMNSVTTLATQAINSQKKLNSHLKAPNFDLEDNSNVIIESLRGDEEFKTDHFRHKSNITIGQQSMQPFQTLTSSSVIMFDALNNTNQALFQNAAYSTQRSNNLYKSMMGFEEHFKNGFENFPQNLRERE